MATNLLMILINIIIIGASLGILYWVVKKAVRNGILEAWQEIKHPSEKIEYPIHIDAEHPDMPFHREDE